MHGIACSRVKPKHHEDVGDCARDVRAADDDCFAGGCDGIMHSRSAAHEAHGIHELTVLVTMLDL